MKSRFAVPLLLIIAGLGMFWWLSTPEQLPAEIKAQLLGSADLANGERAFWAGGCASCHAAKGATGDAILELAGGHRLNTPYGVFVSPNITPDVQTGIGSWSLEDFALAMHRGVSPGGRHYYPAFPYTSYIRLDGHTLRDLLAYIGTLPAVSRINEPHELGFAYRWRRTLGIWKQLYLDSGFVSTVSDDETLQRGRILVEGLGHCGECHTPRNALGGLEIDRWLAGGQAPEGKGFIPNITPHTSGVGEWSADDLVYYFESGFTPDYDSVGGSMVDVQKNLSRLSKQDLEAIAAYLKAVPPLETRR